MNMKDGRKLIVSGILLFLSGFTAGLLLEERVLGSRFNRILTNREVFLTDYFMEKMEVELTLSPEAKSRISNTFREAVKKIREIRESSSKGWPMSDPPDREIEKILKKMSEKISDNLPPDQKIKFEKLEKLLLQ